MNRDLLLLKRVVWIINKKLLAHGIKVREIEFADKSLFYAKQSKLSQEDADCFNAMQITTDKLALRLKSRGLVVRKAKIRNSSVLFHCYSTYREDFFFETRGFGTANVIMSDVMEFQINAKYGEPKISRKHSEYGKKSEETSGLALPASSAH